jgi:hypothetical protein
MNEPLRNDTDLAATVHAGEETMAAFLDGRLEPGETARFEAHLAGCPLCLREFLELKALDGKMGPVPDEFLSRAGVTPRALRMPPHLVWRAATLLLAVAALALLVHLNRPLFQSEPASDASAFRRLRPAPMAVPAPPASDRRVRPEPAPGPTKPRARSEEKKEVGAAKPTAAAVQESLPAPVAEFETPAPNVVRSDANAEMQKKALGEPRLQQRSGPSQNLNQVNISPDLDKARTLGGKKDLSAIVQLEGDLVFGDLQNPEALAGLPGLNEATIVELTVDNSGLITNLDIRTPLAPETKRLLRQVLARLEFAPATPAERHARLVLAAHPGG